MFLTYEKRHNLIDMENLRNHYDEISVMTEYIPYYIRESLREINKDYRPIVDKSNQRFYIHRKNIIRECRYENLEELYFYLEIACFLYKYDMYDIINTELFDDWTKYCEKEYGIKTPEDILNYDSIEKYI